MGVWSVVVNSSGVDIDATYGTVTTAMVGAGMPPLSHNVTQQALIPGALLQSIKVQPRVLQLNLTIPGTTLATYHSIRKDLLDVFKPNTGGTLTPVELRYTGANSTTAVKVLGYYDGGLEGNMDSAGGYFERLAARFICYDPYFYVTSVTNVDVAESASVADADYVVKRVSGVWSNVNTAFNATVRCAAIDASGNLYLGGAFTNVGDGDGDYIVKVAASNGALSSLGTGAGGGNVNAIAIGPDGTVYAGGEFTWMGGVANTDGIAKWDGANWTALGTGVSSGTNHVGALCIDHAGNLYAAGQFSLMGGVANTLRIAKWDGSNWTALGTGLNANPFALVAGRDGLVYVGGLMTAANGVTVNRVAAWTGTTFVNAGSSLLTGSGSEYVVCMALGPDGSLYAGTNYATDSCFRRLSGTAWESLGVATALNAMAFDEEGQLWIGGTGSLVWAGDTGSGGTSGAGDNAAIWNGSVWSATPIDLPGSAQVYCIVHRGTRTVIGYDTAGTATAATQTTVANGGTAPAYPVITIARTGGTTALVQYLRNETTGQTLYLNYDLLAGETLTITLTPGAKAITSSYFGNVIGLALLPNSDFATWCLQPGNNTVSMYVYQVGSPTLTTTCTFNAPHWGADGVAT